MSFVEDINAKNCIQSGVSAQDVFWFDLCDDFLFVAGLDHLVCLLVFVLAPELFIKVGNVGQNMPVCL